MMEHSVNSTIYLSDSVRINSEIKKKEKQSLSSYFEETEFQGVSWLSQCCLVVGPLLLTFI